MATRRKAFKGDNADVATRLRKAMASQPDGGDVRGSVSPETLALVEDLNGIGQGTTAIPDMLNDADWVRSSGKTPLEFLTAVYRHPLVRMTERIAAAKTVVEYTHKKIPSALEMTGKNGGIIKVTASMVAGLSDAELETLEELMLKASRAAETQSTGA